MNANAIAITLALLMGAASAVGVVARPSTKAAAKGNVVSLESIVPTRFAGWAEQKEQTSQVVNPQTKALLDELYSQILTRTYVNADGYRIMLSLAYGDDQRGGLKAHRPEVCYPAQGFKLGTVEDIVLNTSFGNIDARRLTTSLGPRQEPVTYWLTVGDQVIKNAVEKRFAQIRLGLTGQIPDGLLFRVSSIDGDSARGFAMQQKFVADLLGATTPSGRKQLSGLVASPQS